MQIVQLNVKFAKYDANFAKCIDFHYGIVYNYSVRYYKVRKKKRKRRKFVRKIVYLLTVLSIFCYQFLVVECRLSSASEQQSTIKIQSTNGTLVHTNFDFEKASVYEQCALENDIERSTGKIDEDVEKALNYAGVADEDIVKFDKEVIKNCNTIDEIFVEVEYYAETKSGKTLQKLSDAEKEDYFKEYCKEKNICKKNINSVKNFVKNLFSPTKVKANTRKDDKYSSGKFRHTLLMFSQRVNGKKGIYFCYTAKWIKEPYYRGTDLIGLAVDNGKIINTSQYPLKANCSYKQNLVSYGLLNTKETKSDHYSNILPYWKYFGSNSAVVYVPDLPGEGGYLEAQSRALALQNGGRACFYNDITYSVHGYATKSSNSVKDVCVNAYYGHQESTVTIKPSVMYH